MVIQGKKFQGVVEFDYDREDYIGSITLHNNWVFINNEEYIPFHKITSVTCEETNTMTSE